MTTVKRLMPGVFIGSHAVAEGWLTPTQLRERSYRRVVQGVYADPGLELDHRLRCHGVGLLLPDGAVIGGLSAAAWYGAPMAGWSDPVTVLRPETVRWTGPRGVRVHRTVLDRADCTTTEDLPLTTAARTSWDVAALEPTGTAVAALDAMVRSGTVTVAELHRVLRRGTGRWGVTRVRRAVPLVDPRAESVPESRVRVALVLAGLAPVPQHEVFSGGRFLARVDLAFPDVRLAIEYEGAHHFEDGQIARDDERLGQLRAAGWTVIRLGSADLRRLDAVVEQVEQALGALRPQKA